MGRNMNEDERLQLCIQELSMMTGVVNKDIDYLLYLLLKDGTLFEEEKKPYEENNDMAVSTFEDWFDKL